MLENVVPCFAPCDAQRLWYAAREGDLQGLKAALDDGADVNVRMSEYSDTPLLIASYGGHVDCVAALLAAGAKPNMADKVDRGTALFWASQVPLAWLFQRLPCDRSSPAVNVSFCAC